MKTLPPTAALIHQALRTALRDGTWLSTMLQPGVPDWFVWEAMAVLCEEKGLPVKAECMLLTCPMPDPNRSHGARRYPFATLEADGWWLVLDTENSEEPGHRCSPRAFHSKEALKGWVIPRLPGEAMPGSFWKATWSPLRIKDQGRPASERARFALIEALSEPLASYRQAALEASWDSVPSSTPPKPRM